MKAEYGNTAAEYLRDAERAAGDLPGIPDVGDWRPTSAAVVGAGTMGGGIATAFTNAGIPVTLIDRTPEDIKRGYDSIRRNYAASVQRGRVDHSDADARLARISTSTELTSVAGADVVIEAVFEEMATKQAIFAELGRHARSDAVLGTNTSTLDIDQIASATKRPEIVIGSHFFSPANVMRLLEVVPGAKTDAKTVARLMALGRSLGKVAVRSGNRHGFIGNAMLLDYLRQAMFLVEEGALPADVDRVLQDFGMAMGPFVMTDMAGHDLAVDSKRRALTTRPTDRRWSDLELFLVDRGRLGQKSGAGWYRYEPNTRRPLPDPDFDADIVGYSKGLGLERRRISDEEILHRCLYALVNRAAHLLGEGTAGKPGDIDVVYTSGYGFPARTGGPLYWADTIGPGRVLSEVERFARDDPYWWQPAPLLIEIAQSGSTFGCLGSVTPSTGVSPNPQPATTIEETRP